MVPEIVTLASESAGTTLTVAKVVLTGSTSGPV